MTVGTIKSPVGWYPRYRITHSVNDAEAASATLSGLVNINPADPVEGMLAVQIIAAHETALSLRRRAQPEQSFVVQTRFLELADKVARTLAVLIENS